MDALRWALVAFGLWLISGTALSLSHHPHWYVRGWDFPRVLVGALALGTGVAYRALAFTGRGWEIAFLAALGAVVAYQASRTVAFTRLSRKQVRDATRPAPERTVRIAISNLRQDNREHGLWRSVVTRDDPDVVVALEVDRTWRAALAPLEETHPHVVERVQDNYYGMALFSRLPLGAHEVRFVADDDVPSIRAEISLRGGDRVLMYALHPKPPEPLRDQDSAPRDAELVLVAKEIARAESVPTVVCGDLNDVAWSDTTRIFLRLSRLLDPRVGRFLLNTYDANNPIFRFPLDHAFHSKHFTLVRMERLPKVGSDHFPVLIELSLEPEKAPEQAQKPAQAEEREAAAKMVERGTGGSDGAARG